MVRASSAAPATRTRGRGPMTRCTAAEHLPPETEASTWGAFWKVVTHATVGVHHVVSEALYCTSYKTVLGKSKNGTRWIIPSPRYTTEQRIIAKQDKIPVSLC